MEKGAGITVLNHTPQRGRKTPPRVLIILLGLTLLSCIVYQRRPIEPQYHQYGHIVNDVGDTKPHEEFTWTKVYRHSRLIQQDCDTDSNLTIRSLQQNISSTNHVSRNSSVHVSMSLWTTIPLFQMHPVLRLLSFDILLRFLSFILNMEDQFF